MAKESGLGMSVIVDDSGGVARTISNDITEVKITMPNEVLVVTGVDVSAVERLLAHADLEISFSGVFNDAAAMSHAVFKDYRTNTGTEKGRTTAIAHSGQTLTEDALLLTAYNLNRAADGSLTFEVPGMLADGTVPAWS